MLTVFQDCVAKKFVPDRVFCTFGRWRSVLLVNRVVKFPRRNSPESADPFWGL